MVSRRKAHVDSDMSTKEVFLLEALKLFAEEGYDNVSVSQIAKKVGCSAPALYKHYPNKQALFEGVLAMSERGYKIHMDEFVNMNANDEKFKQNMLEVNEEKLVDIMNHVFDHLVHDEYPSLFRKILIAEQFRNKELAKMYNERYVEQPVLQYTGLFTMLQKEGVFDPDLDPKVLAIQYVLPTAVLVSVCDREPEKEEWAREQLSKHVRLFAKTYIRNK